ncbi:hypothetical protein D918_06478 [Trichuris suis]|nr:hypothetical protein D918_06478 [Trichuris suis]
MILYVYVHVPNHLTLEIAVCLLLCLRNARVRYLLISIDAFVIRYDLNAHLRVCDIFCPLHTMIPERSALHLKRSTMGACQGPEGHWPRQARLHISAALEMITGERIIDNRKGCFVTTGQQQLAEKLRRIGNVGPIVDPP